MTIDELNQRIKKSEKDIKVREVHTQKEVEQYFQKKLKALKENKK